MAAKGVKIEYHDWPEIFKRIEELAMDRGKLHCEVTWIDSRSTWKLKIMQRGDNR